MEATTTEWRVNRRKGDLPGELVRECVARRLVASGAQRNDPLQRGGDVALTLSPLPDKLTAPLVASWIETQWSCRRCNGGRKYADAPEANNPLCPTGRLMWRRGLLMKGCRELKCRRLFLYGWEERVVCMATVRFGVRKVVDRY